MRGEATSRCTARRDDAADEKATPTTTRHSPVVRASTVFVAVATAATIALGVSVSPFPVANFFRAEAVEMSQSMGNGEAAEDTSAVAMERERDRRAAERVVDAFLALSRDDQIKVVDRLVFAGDADRRESIVASTSAPSKLFTETEKDLKAPPTESGKGSENEKDTADAPEALFAAADARDGWALVGDDEFQFRDETTSLFAATKRTFETSTTKAANRELIDDGGDGDDISQSDSDPKNETPKDSVNELTKFAATAAVRFSETAPELFAKFFAKFVNGDLEFPNLDPRLGFAFLVGAALLPEIKNAAVGSRESLFQSRDGGGGDPGYGDSVQKDGDTIKKAGDGDPKKNGDGAVVASDTNRTPENKPETAPAASAPGVLWRRKDDTFEDGGDEKENSSYAQTDRTQNPSVAPVGSGTGAGGLLWRRAEVGEDTGARKRNRLAKRRARRAGGRNGLDENDELDADDSVPGSIPRESGFSSLVSKPIAFGPVEDENMENVRFAGKDRGKEREI